MLVAKRDPFHPGAHDAPYSEGDGGAGPRAAGAPRLARTMSVLQMVGTLLAIPIGIGSGYSMYRANFSVETTCQSLRANIVSMLDKSVDARTRHMLVRRDVVAFGQTCGTVDPDATAAFKALLAADQTAAPAVTATVRRVEAKPKEVARKAEPRTEAAARQPGASSIPVAAEPNPVQRDATDSDASWLAAVRGALTTRAAEPVQPDDAADVAVANPGLATVPPIVQPVSRDTRATGEVRVAMPAVATRAPAWPPAIRQEAAATVAAPAPALSPVPILPPATSVAVAPAPAQPMAIAPAPAPDADHPVPPAFIPLIAPASSEAAAERHPSSRLGALIAQIPFLGPMIETK